MTEFAEVTLSFYTPCIDDTDIYMLQVKIVGLSAVKTTSTGDGSPLLYAPNDYHGQELYAPPEVLVRHFGQYAPAQADMWSLGVILFELLLGYVPFATKDQAIEVVKSGAFPTQSWSVGDPEFLDDIGVAPLFGLCCFQGNPAKRSSIEALKAHEWLHRTDTTDLHAPFPSDSEGVQAIANATNTCTTESSSSATLSELKDHFSLDITLNRDFVRTYRLGPILGVGGFGCVVKALHRISGHEVAFKFIRKSRVLPTGWAVDDHGRRLPLEVKLMTMASHENIAGSLDVFQDAEFYYIVSCHSCGVICT